MIQNYRAYKSSFCICGDGYKNIVTMNKCVHTYNCYASQKQKKLNEPQQMALAGHMTEISMTDNH